MRLLMGACLCVVLFPGNVFAGEDDLPSDDQIEKSVKAALPDYLTFRCVEKKLEHAGDADAQFHAVLTVAAMENLFKDATEETLPSGAVEAAPSGTAAPPLFLKKLRRAGEIIEIPIDLRFKQSDRIWKPAAMEDRGRIDELGRPLASFKAGALVIGTPEARRALEQYLADLKKQAAAAAAKKPAATEPSPRTEKPKTEAARPVEETPPETVEQPAAAAPKTDAQKVKELEYAVYARQTDEKSKPDYTTLKALESKTEKLLTGGQSDEEVQTFRRKSRDDLLDLAANYRDVSRQIELEDQTRAMNLQVVYQTYAEAYTALAKGDVGDARLKIKRAREKRDDIRADVVRKDKHSGLSKPKSGAHYKGIEGERR